jgi:putative transposase
MAGYLVAAFRVPTRRACGVVQCNRATFYYRSPRRDVTPLRMRLWELAAARPRFGYRRLHILLRREGGQINHKKTYRLYRDEQLGVRGRRRRKRASQLRVRPAAPTRPNERSRTLNSRGRTGRGTNTGRGITSGPGPGLCARRRRTWCW